MSHIASIWMFWPSGINALQRFVKLTNSQAIVERTGGFVRLDFEETGRSIVLDTLDASGLGPLIGSDRENAREAASRFYTPARITASN